MEGVQHLKLPLEEIKLATDNFSEENFIARGGFGNIYKGKLSLSGQMCTVTVKRLDRSLGQGDREFLMEIQMLSCYKHKNLISLIGFCDENKEKILVYDHATHGSLDKYLSNADLSWMQRLQISLGAACGFNYLHCHVGPQHRVLHRDIKSSNILLDNNWEAKISDFGLSKIGPSNLDFTFLVTNACGSYGYLDPLYLKTGILTKESDIYSFGVVLFEILCGRLACMEQYQDERRFLASLAQRHYEENSLEEIISPNLRNQMKPESLNMFAKIAYQCLKDNRRERPTIGQIVKNLAHAVNLQVSNQLAQTAKVGMWGKTSGSLKNHWSFLLKKDHNLKKITIDHGNLIYSLIFTNESDGILNTCNKSGGRAGGNTVSEVTFDGDEEIIGINGTIGTYNGHTIISSLSFVTSKRIHGPFGLETASGFSVPWEEGSFAGFYGLADNYIDAIGVYLKATKETIRVGHWGRKWGYPKNDWFFRLPENHYLKEITIDHGDLIYSLVFTTTYMGSSHSSDKAGGWNGGDNVSKVKFDRDEEIIGINGTIALSRGYDPGNVVVSSLSFITNKRTHGPFGVTRGEPFSVSWDNRSFAGFYGLCGYIILIALEFISRLLYKSVLQHLTV